MDKEKRERPEVDEFRYTLYDHLGIEQHDHEARDFIHEMAHNLYNQAYMKANGRTEAAGEGSPLLGMVSWLKQRKDEVDKERHKIVDEDGEISGTYQRLYESYSTVIGDIIMHNKEAN